MRTSDIAEHNFQIHGIVVYSDKWSQIMIVPHLVKSGEKHHSQGHKSKSVWERPNKIIDINMDTERKTCGAKARNSRTPASNVILNLIMFTTEVLK